jgi:glutathione S-transferase
MPSKNPSARFLVHGNVLSMPTYKVALMLSLSGEPYDWDDVDIFTPEFRRGERSEAFLGVSRFGQVPALTDRLDGTNLVQSNLILTYLAEETGKFLPATRRGRLRAQEWLGFESGRLFEGFAGVRYLSRFAGGDPLVVNHYRNHVNKQLGILDRVLEDKEWLTDGIPSIADISLFALTSFAPEIEVDLATAYPAIARWHARMRELPGYASSDDLLGAFVVTA